MAAEIPKVFIGYPVGLLVLSHIQLHSPVRESRKYLCTGDRVDLVEKQNPRDISHGGSFYKNKYTYGVVYLRMNSPSIWVGVWGRGLSPVAPLIAVAGSVDRGKTDEQRTDKAHFDFLSFS